MRLNGDLLFSPNSDSGVSILRKTSGLQLVYTNKDVVVHFLNSNVTATFTFMSGNNMRPHLDFSLQNAKRFTDTHGLIGRRNISF